MLQASFDLSASFHAAMQRLGPWEAAPHLAVACSGGADSLSLALLAQDWVQQQAGGSLTALVVDHGLRAASAAEARRTQHRLAQHGVAAALLSLQLSPAEPGLQARARAARYAALTDWCRAHGTAHLLLGHHRDDQAETFLFRLLRGSGPEGLAAMAMRRRCNGVQLLRPLLGIGKTQCEAYLRARALAWIDDPSNDNPAFARVRIRRWLEAHASEAERARLAALAARFGAWRSRHEQARAVWLTAHAALEPCGVARLSEALFDLSVDAALSVLRVLLCAVDGGKTAPRGADLLRLLEALWHDPATTRSLHRCLIVPQADGGGGWLICREPAHAAAPLSLAPGATVHWDRRFTVRLSGDAPQGVSVGALGEAGLAELQGETAALPPGAYAGLPRAALLSLPAIRHLEALRAVPHIGYRHPAWAKNLTVIHHAPAKALADDPFFPMNEGSEPHTCNIA